MEEMETESSKRRRKGELAHQSGGAQFLHRVQIATKQRRKSRAGANSIALTLD